MRTRYAYVLGLSLKSHNFIIEGYTHIRWFNSFKLRSELELRQQLGKKDYAIYAIRKN